MDFWELLVVLARRWLIVVPLLLLTVLGAWGVHRSVPPTYTASGSILVTGPADRDARDLNALALAGGTTVTRTLQVASAGPDFVSKVVEQVGHADYTVSASESAIVTVRVERSDEEEAAATVSVVLDLLAAELEAQQAALGAPPESFLRLLPLNPSPTIEISTADSRLAAVGAAVVGFALSCAVALIVDQRARVKRERRLLHGKDLDDRERHRLLRERLRVTDQRMQLLEERDRLLDAYGVPRMGQRTRSAAPGSRRPRRQPATSDGTTSPSPRPGADDEATVQTPTTTDGANGDEPGTGQEAGASTAPRKQDASGGEPDTEQSEAARVADGAGRR